ncbi:MAG: DUF2807 domain-containing protein [Gluconacetobacter diazotrophicus]|nr:DUF2807 domain-containing protein [Gluconacetobacter diazotrophicus]
MPMFPITDPAREDDIRMRRRRAVLLLGGIGLTGFLLFGGNGTRTSVHRGADWRGEMEARIRSAAEQRQLAAERGREAAERAREAAERNGAVAGATGGGVVSVDGQVRRDFPVSGPIVIDIRCADGLHLTTDGGTAAAAGPNMARATATGENAQDALGRLEARPDGIGGDCGREQGSAVTIALPPGHPMTIVQNADGDISGDRFGDAMTVRVTGSGNVKLERVGDLQVEIGGSGDVAVDEMEGNLAATIRASGDLSIGGGGIHALSAEIEGSGDLSTGTASVGPTALRVDGSSTVTIREVAGPLDAHVRGSGEVTMQQVEAEVATLELKGSGTIAVRGGRIGRLDASRQGSGTLQVLATVENGTLGQSGSGSTEIPHGTLQVSGSAR